MRIRLNLPPPQCSSNMKCKCGTYSSSNHLISCCKFTQKRSIIHYAVPDCINDLLKCDHHPVRSEPLFDEFYFSLSQEGSDIQCAWYDGTELIINCITVSASNRSSNSDVQHLLKVAELFKKSKYEALLQRPNGARGIKFVPIAISIFGTIGSEGLHFLDDLEKLLKETGHTFDSFHLEEQNRISLFKALPGYINSILNNITEFYNKLVAIQVNSENLQ
ncbi:hypothetical protein P9112_012543 [Eukaryota sp. TZLM1-RC]